MRFGLRRSITFSGPPVPWNASAPRSLCSARMKYGSTSFHAHPGFPCAAHSS